MTMNRPTITRVRRYFWLDGDDRIQGIGLMSDYGIKAHLTPDEAIQVANDIVDTLEGD